MATDPENPMPARYEKPCLVRYGRVASLTAGGSQVAANEFSFFGFRFCGPERMTDPGIQNSAFMC